MLKQKIKHSIYAQNISILFKRKTSLNKILLNIKYKANTKRNSSFNLTYFFNGKPESRVGEIKIKLKIKTVNKLEYFFVSLRIVKALLLSSYRYALIFFLHFANYKIQLFFACSISDCN